jgi:hypothetical protein
MTLDRIFHARFCHNLMFDTPIHVERRSYCYTSEENGKGRRTLTREAVLTAVQKTDPYDFLVRAFRV